MRPRLGRRLKRAAGEEVGQRRAMMRVGHGLHAAMILERLAADRRSGAALLRRDGEGWKPATYQRGFKAALKAAGLEDISLHELRHSNASTMVRAGAPLIVVARALGHADTRMVDKHYAHLAPSYVADVIRSTAPDLCVPGTREMERNLQSTGIEMLERTSNMSMSVRG